MNDIVFTALIMLIEKHILLVPKDEYMKKLELAEEVMKDIDMDFNIYCHFSCPKIFSVER